MIQNKPFRVAQVPHRGSAPQEGRMINKLRQHFNTVVKDLIPLGPACRLSIGSKDITHAQLGSRSQETPVKPRQFQKTLNPMPKRALPLKSPELELKNRPRALSLPALNRASRQSQDNIPNPSVVLSKINTASNFDSYRVDKDGSLVPLRAKAGFTAPRHEACWNEKAVTPRLGREQPKSSAAVSDDCHTGQKRYPLPPEGAPHPRRSSAPNTASLKRPRSSSGSHHSLPVPTREAALRKANDNCVNLRETSPSLTQSLISPNGSFRTERTRDPKSHLSVPRSTSGNSVGLPGCPTEKRKRESPGESSSQGKRPCPENLGGDSVCGRSRSFLNRIPLTRAGHNGVLKKHDGWDPIGDEAQVRSREPGGETKESKVFSDAPALKTEHSDKGELKSPTLIGTGKGPREGPRSRTWNVDNVHLYPLSNSGLSSPSKSDERWKSPGSSRASVSGTGSATEVCAPSPSRDPKISSSPPVRSSSSVKGHSRLKAWEGRGGGGPEDLTHWEDPLDLDLDLELENCAASSHSRSSSSSSSSSDEEPLLSLKEILDSSLRPPVTPEKGSFSEPSTPATKMQQTVKNRPVNYQNTLEKMLKERENNQRIKDIEEKLLLSCREVILRLEEEEADDNDKAQEAITQEHRELLQRFSVMPNVIPDLHPGEEVFTLSNFGRLFNQQNLDLRRCAVVPQNVAQRSLLRASPEQLLLQISTGLLLKAYRSSPCQPAVAKWLFQMMSVHTDRMSSTQILKSLMDIALIAVDQIVVNDSKKFEVWLPSVQDVTHVFLNMGVPFVTLFPLEALQPSFTEGDILQSTPICTEDLLIRKEGGPFPVHNVENVIKYMALVSALCPRAYSDHELLLLLTMVGKLSLETRLQLQPVEDLCSLLHHLVNNMRDWDSQLPRICLALTNLTVDHHNHRRLVQLLPDNKRGKQLRKHLCVSIISKLLNHPCTYKPTNSDFQLSDLRRYLPKMRPSSLLNLVALKMERQAEEEEGEDPTVSQDQQAYYLCYSLLALINEASNFESLPSNQKNQLSILSAELDMHIKSEIRESEKYLYRSKVKDFVARIYTKWQVLLLKSRPLQGKLCDYWQPLPEDDFTGSQEEEVEVGLVLPAGDAVPGSQEEEVEVGLVLPAGDAVPGSQEEEVEVGLVLPAGDAVPGSQEEEVEVGLVLPAGDAVPGSQAEEVEVGLVLPAGDAVPDSQAEEVEVGLVLPAGDAVPGSQEEEVEVGLVLPAGDAVPGSQAEEVEVGLVLPAGDAVPDSQAEEVEVGLVLPAGDAVPVETG